MIITAKTKPVIIEHSDGLIYYLYSRYRYISRFNSVAEAEAYIRKYPKREYHVKIFRRIKKRNFLVQKIIYRKGIYENGKRKSPSKPVLD